jgi:uncharacterized caspase-like protein
MRSAIFAPHLDSVSRGDKTAPMIRPVSPGEAERPVSREAGDRPPPKMFPVGERWAVLVGVSAYEDSRLDLKYAARDAVALRDLILTPTGGGFEEARVLALVDGRATTREVTRALRSFLTRPAPEDLVLIYLACHGGPDPRRPNGPLYLLTHDTEPDDIAGTAVPMDEIQRSLQNSILAERVVIIADTCHSAALGGRGTRGVTSAEATNQYLSELGRTKPGVALLTSAEAAESSQEDARWGGGHGVFTHHLLEGMRGAADGFDRPRDGIVGVGELFDYVRKRVTEDTVGSQHPAIGSTPFDRNLPMAVTGNIDVEQHLEFARALLGLGWLTDDPAAFACAAREAELAQQFAALTRERLPESAKLRAEALLASGHAAEAVAALEVVPAPAATGTPNGDSTGRSPSVQLVRGLALAESGHPAAAAQALAGFVEVAPEDDEASWVRDYAAALEASTTGRRLGLLIGIAAYKEPVASLRGPVPDVGMMRNLLVEHCRFAEADLQVLLDGAATRQSIIHSLTDLATTVGPDDVVVVTFSGHAATAGGADEMYLVPYDYPDTEGRGITGRELAEMLGAISGRSRLLVLDTHLTESFRDLMEAQTEWTVLVGTEPGRFAYEGLQGEEVGGAFTQALCSAWAGADDPSNLTYGLLVDETARRLQEGYDQTPLLIGNRGAHVLGPTFPANVWRLTRLRAFSRLDGRSCAALLDALNAYPLATWAIGRCQSQHGMAADAVRTLELARDRLGSGRPLLELDLAGALLATGRTQQAAEVLTRCAALPGAPAEVLTRANRAVETLAVSRGKALVVGIDDYSEPKLPVVRGAVADATSFAAMLTSQAAFDPTDVVMLQGKMATRERVLTELGRLATHAKTSSAVFYFAGAGSWNGSAQQTILSVDARTDVVGVEVPDISLTELAVAAGPGASHLVTILDAGGGPGSQAVQADGVEAALAGTRTALPAARRAGDHVASSVDGDIAIGAVTIRAAVAIGEADGIALEQPMEGSGRVRGRLTAALEQALGTSTDLATLTYTDWVSSAGLGSHVHVTGVAAGEPVFRHRSALAAAVVAVRELERAPAHRCRELATWFLAIREARDEESPRLYLALGLAHAALGEPGEAIARLQTARNLYDDASIMTEQLKVEPASAEWQRWARYHLGRLLYQEDGDLNEAVASLRAAHRQAPDDPGICLHLAQAIRLLVERESMVEVGSLLRRYLDLGAPLGRVPEVREFLRGLTTR